MTETKRKPDSAAKLVIVLLLISAITALLLGLVNYITADRIAEINAEKTANAMEEVMPGDYSFEGVDGTWNSKLVTTVYAAKSGSDIGGYVVQVAPSGFGGTLDIVVGVTPEGEVTGVSIISHSETSGLGAEATKPDFRSQFVGASEALAVNKDGGTIDALTGATVTSRAVTNGVNAAIEAVMSMN